ncbi:MAG TPA: serine/threonine-protein kinase [Micromonosporaceae bacterium]
MTDLPSGALPVPVVPGLADLSLIARGGYATIYRAVQEFVGREVAVKVENRTLVSERDRQRFLREARAAARMSSHPHVVDLFDAGITADGHPYLIMELCDGSYADAMRAGGLSAAETRDLGVKIADALADAHRLGVLHRDVKPANILRTRFGEPALADFGLAVIAEVRDPTVTIEVLTPAYAPPEMFRNAPPSPAVDVYALSATLYAVMHGRPPRWTDDTSPSLVTILELFNEPIHDLPGVPPAMIEILRRGMANDPNERPSARELRDSLAALPIDAPAGADDGSYPTRPAVHLSWATRPDDTTVPIPAAGSATAATGRPPAAVPAVAPDARYPVPQTAASHARLLPWLLGIVAVLATLAVIAAAWLVSERRPVVSPTPTTRAARIAPAPWPQLPPAYRHSGPSLAG